MKQPIVFLSLISITLTSCTLSWSKPLPTHQDSTPKKDIQVNIDTIRTNDRVNISYQLKDENNRVVESSNDIAIVV